MSQPTLDMTPVGAKIPDAKTPATDSTASKERSWKDYITEDPDSDQSFSYLLSINSDLYDDTDYKRRRHNIKKNNQKRKE